MRETVVSYELWKLEVPAGRVIGDCTCRYETLDVLVLCLTTDQGHQGWGFGESVSDGVFAQSAPWIIPMPELGKIRQDFRTEAWPAIRGRNPFSINLGRPKVFADFSPTSSAVRLALWDLMAKSVDLPLYQLLGGSPERNRVRGYGSGLDYHLNELEAVDVFQHFVSQGFTALKVKVGRPDVRKDLRRLKVVREAVGDEIELAIDANEAWNAGEALLRIQIFQGEGLDLSYVEDPLPRYDIDGLIRLKAMLNIDVVGHDYVLGDKAMRCFLERSALSRLRVLAEPDVALASSDLASEFGVPIIFGNSIFELAVHSAAALPNVDRMEFSNLDWNLIPLAPIRFENGYAIAPSGSGHSLQPNLDALSKFSRPGPSKAPEIVS